MDTTDQPEFRWLRTGQEGLSAMLQAIAAAKVSVRLEMYTFNPSAVAERFRDSLTDARKRGLRVWVLLDALGSMDLPESFWDPFRAAGGEFRWFNPIILNRLAFRDHRKLLLCDDAVAFVGGFNVAAEYEGDGVTSGWRDLGMEIRGPMVGELASAADEMFADAAHLHKAFSRLRKSPRQKTVTLRVGKLLLSAPGRDNPLKTSLRLDLNQGRDAAIICAYFLPPLRIRNALARLARRGGRVRLILPGKTDVPLSRMAARSLYRRLLTAGVEIYEYQPQILHAKCFIIDDIVYAGSSNLDSRSLNINYEFMARVADARLAADGREIFAQILALSSRIDLEQWRRSRTLWDRIKGRFARWLLNRVDPYLAKQSS